MTARSFPDLLARGCGRRAFSDIAPNTGRRGGELRAAFKSAGDGDNGSRVKGVTIVVFWDMSKEKMRGRREARFSLHTLRTVITIDSH